MYDQKKRFKHNLVESYNKKIFIILPDNKLNPFWITGLCENSGNFVIIPSFRKLKGKLTIQIGF